MQHYKDVRAIYKEWQKQLAKHGKGVVRHIPLLSPSEVADILEESPTTIADCNACFIASKSLPFGVYFSDRLCKMNKKDAKLIILHELAHYLHWLLYNFNEYCNNTHGKHFRRICKSIRGIPDEKGNIYYNSSGRLWLGKPKR